MKKELILIASSFVLLCCTNKATQSKLESIISKDIQNSLPKHQTYEPLSFSKVDSAMSLFIDTKEYKTLAEKIFKIDSTRIYDSLVYVDNLYFMGSTKPNSYKCAQYLIDEKKQINSQIENLKEKYIPHYIGKFIAHKYKCSTDFGDTIYISNYVIDDNLNIIKKERFPYIE